MRIKKRTLSTMVMAVVVSLVIYGCYPGGPEYTSDYSLVITDYDTEFNFGNKKTYYMPDTIGFNTNDGSITDVTIAQFEKIIIDQIALNMQNQGYERVTDSTGTSEPDLFIATYAITVENQGVGWVPGWGGGYWGWGWGGWYYPPYYPVSYSYNTGTVLIFMGDPNADPVLEDGQVQLPLIWAVGLDGLLSSTKSNNVNAVINGINQAFIQSPYLKSN